MVTYGSTRAELTDQYVPIDHLHYDVIHAKPDGSCSRPAETGPSFPFGKASGQYPFVAGSTETLRGEH